MKLIGSVPTLDLLNHLSSTGSHSALNKYQTDGGKQPGERGGKISANGWKITRPSSWNELLCLDRTLLLFRRSLQTLSYQNEDVLLSVPV